MCSSVSASKPENTSSRIINSFLAYTALASATRCFWPPFNEIPALPTSVARFCQYISQTKGKTQTDHGFGMLEMSLWRPQQWMTLLYHDSWNADIPRIFSRIVPFRTHGD